jgi:predicted lactoylglutathione lyase
MKNEFWLNLAVKDIKKSQEFFTELGFGHKNFCETMVTILAGKDEMAINLFLEEAFESFSGNDNCDTSKATEILFNIGADTKEEVDEFAVKVRKAGGIVYRGPEEKDGWMYGCGFTDLDGHRWSKLFMDMKKMPNGGN